MRIRITYRIERNEQLLQEYDRKCNCFTYFSNKYMSNGGITLEKPEPLYK